MKRIVTLFASLVALTTPLALAQTPLGTAINYQGQIREAGSAVDSTADFEFTLHDADMVGNLIAGPITATNVSVVDGLFNVEIDFGSGMFGGDARWIEIAVRSPHDPTDLLPFTPLNPRQPLTAAPVAQYAMNAGQWQTSGSNIMNTNSGFVGINRDYLVGAEWFGVHAPVNSGYGGMYVTTEGATALPFYGYHTGTERAWHYVDGGTGDWNLYVDGNRMTVTDEGNIGMGTTTPAHRLHVRSAGDKAIFGEATSTSNAVIGVHGTTASSNGFAYGVMGEITNAAGVGVAVYGEAPFYGVMGRALGSGVGVLGYSQGIGMYGEGQTGEGVLGVTYSTNPLIAGVTGYGDNRGVFGQAQLGSGQVAGVYGVSSSPSGFGVHGVNSSSGGFAYGVLGELTDPTSTGVGVLGRAQFYGVTGEATGAGVGVIGRSNLGVYGESTASGGTGVMGANTASSGTTYGVYGTVNSSTGYAGYFLGRGYFQADLGVGVTPPSYRLDVREASTSANIAHIERQAIAFNGSDLLELQMDVGSDPGAQFIECQLGGGDAKFRVWGDGDVSADGVYTAGGADFAELVRVSAGADSVEAGDVMVIDPANPRAFLKSAGARSTLVAGIYSTQPGILGSEHDWDAVARDLFGDDSEDGEEAHAVKPMALGGMIDEVPLAVVGIVPCKVSAENGKITPGDLLVTSGTPGCAMRDDNPRAGTIVGKALGSLDSATGVIRVLVTLQ